MKPELKAFVVIAAAGTILVACPAEDNGGGSCKEDFDCDVGEVCKGATADADGACETAGEGAERNFGRVSLQFDTGSETYLLGLFDVPRTEASPDALVSFTLSAGGAPAALRLAPKPAIAAQIDDDFWRARLSWEAARRAGIDRLVRDVRAGRRILRDATTRQAGDCSACATSTTEMCWQGSCTSAPVVKSVVNGDDLPCTLVTVAGVGSVDVNVLIDDDDDDPGARNAATLAATEFADALEREHVFLGLAGHTGGLDRDGDGRVTVVYSEKLAQIDPDFVGGFSYKDFLPASDAEASGNEADLMWARVPSQSTIADCTPSPCTEITQELSLGTLAHEYTHLVNFGTRVYGAGATPADNEVLWLDEGMAHLMEDIAGFNASNIGAASVALSEWPSATFASPVDSVAQRGMAYLLLRHIVDRKGAAGGNARDAATRYKIHDVLLHESNALGFRHGIFQERGADGIWSWMLATFATNNSNVTESSAQSEPYLDTATVADTAQTTGFNPFGTFTDARGNEVVLEGPALGDGSTDELSNFAEPFASEVKASGAIYYLVTGLPAGETVLTGRGDAQSDLRMRVQRVW